MNQSTQKTVMIVVFLTLSTLSFGIMRATPKEHATHSPISVSSVQSQDLSYPNFNTTSGLVLNGNAVQSGNSLRLTSAALGQAGSAWYNTKENVSLGFASLFRFQISAQGPGSGGADGLTFGIQNNSTSALGGSGGGIGYDGIRKSIVVEFDTFQNSNYGDISSNEVAVHTNGTGLNSASESYALPPGPVTPSVQFHSDGLVHTAKVFYANKIMAIFLDDLTNPILSVPVNIAAKLSLQNGTAYVGFTSSTGGSYENNDILSWSFNTFSFSISSSPNKLAENCMGGTFPSCTTVQYIPNNFWVIVAGTTLTLNESSESGIVSLSASEPTGSLNFQLQQSSVSLSAGQSVNDFLGVQAPYGLTPNTWFTITITATRGSTVLTTTVPVYYWYYQSGGGGGCTKTIGRCIT